MLLCCSSWEAGNANPWPHPHPDTGRFGSGATRSASSSRVTVVTLCTFRDESHSDQPEGREEKRGVEFNYMPLGVTQGPLGYRPITGREDPAPTNNENARPSRSRFGRHHVLRNFTLSATPQGLGDGVGRIPAVPGPALSPGTSTSPPAVDAEAA